MSTPAAQLFAGWTEEQYLAFAGRLAACATTWLTYWRMAGCMLPKAKSAEDIVADAFSSVLFGRRSWDSTRHPDFEEFMKMVVASEELLSSVVD